MANRKNKEVEDFYISKTEKAYIAGFIDGEGSILLVKNNDRGLQPRICIYNSHKETLDWMAGKINAKNRLYDRRRDKLHHKDGYVISLSATEHCKLLLEKIFPYLKIKSDNASMVLSYIYSKEMN